MTGLKVEAIHPDTDDVRSGIVVFTFEYAPNHTLELNIPYVDAASTDDGVKQAADELAKVADTLAHFARDLTKPE